MTLEEKLAELKQAVEDATQASKEASEYQQDLENKLRVAGGRADSACGARQVARTRLVNFENAIR